MLYSVGRIPQSQEVSDFCQGAERSSARVTLIVCDANRDIDSYDELLSGLKSRGRRVVVVGSQYMTGDSVDMGSYAKINASTALSETERSKLSRLLTTYDLADGRQLDGDHFLATLYRHLPASRPQIGSGLGAEARAAVELLDERGSKPHAVPVISQLHQQLIDKGYVSEYQPIFDQQSNDNWQNDDSSAGKIVDMVMVAGRLNCPVPVNLLLRAVSDKFHRFDSRLVSDLFGELDLIRWKSRDFEGNELLVLPRLPLEAQLICDRRLGSPSAEAIVLIDLIGSVRLGIDSEHEREFLLHLLRQIGRDGPRGTVYKRAYMEVARKLTELRQHFNVTDASLMLQESVFRRSAVREEEVDDRHRFEVLEEAREAVQTALDEIDSGKMQTARRNEAEPASGTGSSLRFLSL